MGFDLSQYATVEERLALFWAAHPDGRIATTALNAGDRSCLFRAEVYANAADPVPMAVGHAYEEKTDRGVNATSHVENCETSAIGRALANWIYAAGKRPSREEMAKVERMGHAPAPSAPQGEIRTNAGTWTPTEKQMKFLYALGHRGATPTSRQSFEELVERLKAAKGES
jgi:hypothetical protein